MVDQDTTIQFYASPRPYKLEQVMSSPITSFMVTGIVNPFGPTLSAVVAVGEIKLGAKLPLVRLMLNPFQSTVEWVGKMTIGSHGDLSVIIFSLSELLIGNCPSLIIVHEKLDSEAAVVLVSEFVQKCEGGRSTSDLVKKHYGNPIRRVSEEIQLGPTHLSEYFTTGEIKKPIPLKKAEGRKLAELLLAEEHSGPEIEAFLYAWKGSIEHAGIPAMESMTIETFLIVLDHLSYTLRFPLAPKYPPTTKQPTRKKQETKKPTTKEQLTKQPTKPRREKNE